MKRLLYLCSMVVLVTSFSVIGGKSYAAHQMGRAQAALMPVRLCSSTPVGIPADQHLAQGIFNGADLATKQWKARFRAAGMNLLPVIHYDYARADASGTDPAKERSNALACVGRTDTFGYDGTLNSSIALISEPITNQAGMVMISPSNTNPVLTSPTPKNRRVQEPYTFNHRLKYVTYYRTVTTDSLQGPAGAIFMKRVLHVASYYLVDDGQTYGVGLAGALDRYDTSGGLGMRKVGTGRVDTTSSSSIATTSSAIADQVVAKNPDVLYCGCNLENAYLLARDARRRGFRGYIMGGDAIFDPSWIKEVGMANTLKNFASSVGLNPLFTSASFRTAYKASYPTFGLGPYDASSYDAANIMLQAILKAYKAGGLRRGTIFQRRASVLPYVADVRWHGAQGLTTFDPNGDTTNRVISIYKVVSGSWSFVQTAPALPGYLKPTT